MIDYSRIDLPQLLEYVFYPRRSSEEPPPDALDFTVQVDPDVHVGCRFYQGDPSWPTILFFHGNGEVASDYDDMSPLYLAKNLNLLVADYRGYGQSGGSPTLTDAAKDCHAILTRSMEVIEERGMNRDLVVMGRSLGSISALELAASHADTLKGVIIESGFTCILSIVFHLGLPLGGTFDNLEGIESACEAMARRVTIPALVMHGDEDTLVPVKEAKKLYDILGSPDKRLVIIEDAEHNTIAFVDIDRYFDEIQDFVRKVTTR